MQAQSPKFKHCLPSRGGGPIGTQRRLIFIRGAVRVIPNPSLGSSGEVQKLVGRSTPNLCSLEVSF